MKNISELFEHKEFEKIIKDYSLSQNGNELLFVVASYASLNKHKEAMNFIEENRTTLFNANPILTIKYNFELRYILKEFDEAYDDLHIFENYPYVNQSVEEVLRNLPKEIREEEKSAYTKKEKSEYEIVKILNSSQDAAEVLNTLSLLKDKDISEYSDSIERILVSNIHKDVRVYALLLLVYAKIDKNIQFNNGKMIIEINPSKVNPPFVGKDYEEVKALFELELNTSVAKIGMQLFSSYVLAIYPYNVFENHSAQEYAIVFIFLAKKYLGDKDISVDKVSEIIIEEVEKVLNENPPISL